MIGQVWGLSESVLSDPVVDWVAVSNSAAISELANAATDSGVMITSLPLMILLNLDTAVLPADFDPGACSGFLLVESAACLHEVVL
jgi:hypothetical protein